MSNKSDPLNEAQEFIKSFQLSKAEDRLQKIIDDERKIYLELIISYLRSDEEKIKENISNIRNRKYRLVWSFFLDNSVQTEEIGISNLQYEEINYYLDICHIIILKQLTAKKMLDQNRANTSVSILKKIPEEWYRLIPPLKAYHFFLLGAINFVMDNEIEAIKNYSLSISYFKRLNNTYNLMKVYNNLGSIHLNSFNFQEALQYLLEAENYSDGFQGTKQYNTLIYNTGLAYYYNKKFRLAERYLLLARNLFAKDNNISTLGYCELNIGNLLFDRGELEEALNRFDVAAELFKSVLDNYGLALSEYDKGLVYQRKGDLDNSFYYFKNAYLMMMDTSQRRGIQLLLYNLYSTGLELDIQGIDGYYQQLQSTPEHPFAVLARCKEMRRSRRLKKIVEAQSTYEKLINSRDVIPDVKIISILELSDMLLEEFIQSKDKEIIREIENLVDKLQDVTRFQKSFWIEAQVHSLKAKLFLFSLDIENAKVEMEKAMALVEQYGYARLEMVMSKDMDRFLSSLDKVTDVVEENMSLIEEIGITSFGELLENMLKNKLVTPDIRQESPVMLLVLHKGLVIHSYNFDHSIEVNEDLIGAFLTAVNDFLGETLKSSHVFDMIKVRENTIIYHAHGLFGFFYVFKGDSYYARKKLKKFVMRMVEDKELWEVLSKNLQRGLILKESTDKLTEYIEEIFLTPVGSR